LAALVGVDFGGSPPANWSSILTVAGAPSQTTLTNVISETGAATPYDLSINTSFSGGANNDAGNPVASTIPQHTQSLAGIDRIVFVDSADGSHSFNATWSDLNPGYSYEVYVFGLESLVDVTPFVDKQSVTISGGSPVIQFTQDPVSLGNLWVNDQIGSSSQALANYRKLMTPTGPGQINSTVQMLAGSDSVVLAGLAIREVGIVVNSTGDTDDGNAANGVTTLREAINLANAATGADTILFDN
jgi:CSLREA domain-containing protein